MLAVIISGETVFSCGCFQGSEEQLREYIDAGEEKLKPSRLLALNFCLEALKL